jgi:cell division protein FtsL
VTTPAAAPVETQVAARTARRRAAERPRGGALVPSGVAWIVGVALLLAGVVAVNVSVLRLNVRLSELDRERARVHAEKAALQAEISSSAAAPRIERIARKNLGLVPANPATTTYVTLRRRGR